MPLPPLLWPLFSSCLSEPSRHSSIALPFPIVALRKADSLPMRQYFDSLSPAYDTSGGSSISAPSQLPRSSPVPVLYLQRTGSSVYLSLRLLSRLTWLVLHVLIPFPFVLTRCSSKSLIALIFLLASISSANDHAGVNPTLGVKVQMVRSNNQRPSTNSPCDKVNVT